MTPWRKHAIHVAWCIAGLGSMLPLPAVAHSFGQVYRLPVPVWLYLYGACAALALSFVVMVFCLTADSGRAAATPAPSGHRLRSVQPPLARGAIGWGGAVLGIGMLGLCIASGLFGVAGPYANFSMTAFWIVFLLGMTYSVALVGDIQVGLNPWLGLAETIGRFWQGFLVGRYRYPARLGYTPALGFYMALVWLELFGPGTPFALAITLSIYTGLNLVGVWLTGARDWFRYAELFSVMFRLLALMAPLAWSHSGPAHRLRPRLRSPFAALREIRFQRVSLLLFILFMLSSTAFDGLHETQAWRRLFWVELYPNVLSGWVGTNPVAAFPVLLRWYGYWQILWLLASPFIYLAVYVVFVALMRGLVGGRRSVMALACQFAPALLPIALAYHLSHYYTLIQTQAIKIVPLASDPFGFGWNLFGTADWWQRTNVPEPSTVWHVQVGVIVLGHIAGVYISHLIALDVFTTRRHAAISQLPMLVLMLAFTVAGLWILAQPIGAS